MIASTLLFKHAKLTHVPDISDVHLMGEILTSLGAKITFENNTFTVDNTHLSLENLRTELFKKARATYYLIPPLLAKFGEVTLTYPGGCSIGKRPIEGIINGLEDLGYVSSQVDETLLFTGKTHEKDVTLNAYFSVGSTIVLLLTALNRKANTRIELAAYEPHVMNMVDMLRSAGANIALRYDHTIIVTPAPLAESMETRVISDYIVSGTMAIIAALTAKEYVDIHDARREDLSAFLHTIKQMGVKYEALGEDSLRVYRSKKLKPTTLQTNIFPGVPTDLQSPTCVLLTQVDGFIRGHDVMFVGRLQWISELENMRGHTALMNPHEAMIFGKTALR